MSATSRKRVTTLRMMLAHLIRVTETPHVGTSAKMINSSWLQRKALEWALTRPRELVLELELEYEREREAELKREIVAESVVRHAGLDQTLEQWQMGGCKGPRPT